ncbi:uncharacterized protein N7498_000192 [Penicillium cinerascens]|uniref:Poly [ADP-ribose] polymerase n=1 Tax=Penicillium cinerascens TaxID=70096 RepID=A0A9W9NGD0_9EURO|nr:uncharacterized protein N7498_000192 [Penicillium cinerascens]KAJ5218093.1 hypothetical protein N7498_000192 [Penicillium cinerascens]
MAPGCLKGCSIALSGTFPGFKHSDLKGMLEDRDASFCSSVTDECTHLVTTQKDVEKNTAKYKAACALATCHIVSLDWLIESIQAVEVNGAKKPFPEIGYILGSVPNGISQDVQKGSNKDTKSVIQKKTTSEALKVIKSDVQVDAKNDQENSAKKRNAAHVDGIEEDSSKKQKDAQKAGFKNLNIPVDEAFLREHIQHKDPNVYIDDAELIWDATLNQTVAAQNNNKFYIIQLLSVSNGQNYFTWTRWGRVGEHGQSACLGDGTLANAMRYFETKFKDKSGLKWENRLDPAKPKKYTFIERNYEEDDEGDDEVKKEETEDSKPKVESALSKPLQNLMSFIFNSQHFIEAMASMSYDAKKLPLGKLSDRTLKNGFSILKELSELIADPSLAQSKYDTGYGTATETLSDQYFTIIPHVFGRNRPPVLDSDAQIKKEVELLDALTDMDVANEIMKNSKEADEINQLDRQFQSLGMEEMTRLDHKSSEFIELSNYLSNSRGATHYLRYQVIDIFRIERQGENDRFNASPYAKVKKSDRRLLWHGSRSTNFGGILSQGLRIAPPEAPVNGYMFGKGVYLADTSSKSANYCCPNNSGNMGLLLLCDAELGDPMLELFDSDYNAGENAQKQGKLATLGLGRSIPAGWKDAGCLNQSLEGVKMPDVSTGTSQGKDKAWLQYNEYIVYDVAQIRQRYLFYVHMK